MNNEPAFPYSGVRYTRDGVDQSTTGMSLRDYFAAKAMQVCPEMDAYNMKDNEGRCNFIARKSYEIADAMLRERTK